MNGEQSGGLKLKAQPYKRAFKDFGEEPQISLLSAPPDFVSSVARPVECVRLSAESRIRAHCFKCGEVGNPGRLRSG